MKGYDRSIRRPTSQDLHHKGIITRKKYRTIVGSVDEWWRSVEGKLSSFLPILFHILIFLMWGYYLFMDLGGTLWDEDC